MALFYCLEKIYIKNRLEKKKKNKKGKKKETISGWIKISAHSFKRIRERVNNYVNNGWHSKVDNKSITKNSVKCFFTRYRQWKV